MVTSVQSGDLNLHIFLKSTQVEIPKEVPKMRHTRPKSAVPDMSFSLDVDSQIASRSKSTTNCLHA